MIKNFKKFSQIEKKVLHRQNFFNRILNFEKKSFLSYLRNLSTQIIFINLSQKNLFHLKIKHFEKTTVFSGITENIWNHNIIISAKGGLSENSPHYRGYFWLFFSNFPISFNTVSCLHLYAFPYLLYNFFILSKFIKQIQWRSFYDK